MITTMFHPFCSECEDIEAVSTTGVLHANDDTTIVLNTVTCKNYDVCARLAKHVEAAIKKNKGVQ